MAARMIVSALSLIPILASLKEEAPKVFIVATSAPASKYALCIACIISGRSTFHFSANSPPFKPLAISMEPIPPSKIKPSSFILSNISKRYHPLLKLIPKIAFERPASGFITFLHPVFWIAAVFIALVLKQRNKLQTNSSY
jgi:hypothetical protein